MLTVLERIRTLVSALTILLLAACGSAPQAAPATTIAAATLPGDWQRIDLPQMALALPPPWVVTAAEDIDPSAAVAEAAAQNPQLAAALERGQIELASGQVQLIAYDLDPANLTTTNYPTNIRVGRQTYPSEPTLQAVADANEQDLRATTGITDVQRAAVEISGNAATRLTSKLQINDTIGNPLTLALEQYLLVNGKDVFIIVFTAPTDQQERYRTIFDQILATLRFK